MQLIAIGIYSAYLRKYLEYTSSLKRQYGSVMNFVLSERLGWDHPSSSLDGNAKTVGTPAASATHLPNGDLKSQREPFTSEDDIKILWNDWPYGIDPKIVHLVVWTKFDLEEDPVTTDLTDRARAQIEEYVMKTFAVRVPRESVSPDIPFIRNSGYGYGVLLWPRWLTPFIVHLVQELAVAEVSAGC